MRRAVLFALALGLAGLAGVAAFAANPLIESPLLPSFANVLGQGGSFTANASGYSSLFYNPAAFANEGGSFTLYSSSAWIYADPARFLSSLGTASASAWLDLMDEQLADGGFGFGLCDGVGYVANGLGIGAVVNVDLYLYGDPAPTAVGDLVITVAYISGAALPIQLGPVKVKLGADIRPMFRIRAPADYAVMTDLVTAQFAGGNPLATLNTTSALYGWALGFDLGAIVEWGPLKFGMVVRDFPRTTFHYTTSAFGDILAALRDTGDLPSGGTAADGYYIPMDVCLGIAYAPDIASLRGNLQPVLHASLNELVAVIRDGRSFLTLLHVGAEIRLLRVVELRAGLNQGHLSFGGGLQLFFVDLQASVFTRELGQSYGDRSSSGLSLEAAIRMPAARQARAPKRK